MTHEGGEDPGRRQRNAHEFAEFEGHIAKEEKLIGREAFETERAWYQKGFYQGRAPLHHTITGLLKENERIAALLPAPKKSVLGFKFEDIINKEPAFDTSFIDEAVRELVEARAGMAEIPGFHIVQEWPEISFASDMNSDNEFVVRFRYEKNEE